MIRYAESLNSGLRELLEVNPRAIILGEDIRDPYGGAFKVTKGLSSIFGDRVINTPISEASITGVAGGMAIAGYYPIVEIMFGDFLTLCADQIINHITKFDWMYNGQLKYSLMIRTPMGGRRGYGATHSQSLEKIFFGVPNIEVVAPSIMHDPGSLLKKFVGKNGLTLFIENKVDYGRRILDEDYLLKKGFHVSRTPGRYETITLALDSESADITIAAYGGCAVLALEAAEELFYKHEIIAEVVIPALVVPLQIEEVVCSLAKTGRLMIVEEGTLTCGWGSELAASIAQHHFELLKHPIKRVASRDMPIGSSKAWEDHVLVQKEDIVKSARGDS